jgi:hypothetical protein
VTEDVFVRRQASREADLLPRLAALTDLHRRRCEPYARVLDAIGHPPATSYASMVELPWLPVRMFKTHVLKSIPDSDVFKVLTSSGTTGEVSRIYLDRAAAAAQTRYLAQTLRVVLGSRRLPMLVIDTPSVIKDRRMFSARGAGVLGMMGFGRDHVWALDGTGELDGDAIRSFVRRHGSAPFLMFGFTYLVWENLFRFAQAEAFDLSNGILIHSGGWKKLADRAVDNPTFRAAFADEVGLTKIHNFYGMVEQIGVIYLEGADGSGLYAPDFADVVIRDPDTWQPAPVGRPGIVEVLSVLPESYPGHVVLTEDLGIVHGIDDGIWPGKRFSILGRLPRAEPRGCSDTFEPASPVPSGSSRA